MPCVQPQVKNMEELRAQGNLDNQLRTESCRNFAVIGGSRQDRRHILTEGPEKCTEMLRALS